MIARLTTLALIWLATIAPGLLKEFLNDPNDILAFMHGFYVAWTADLTRGREYELELHYWR